MEAKSEELIFLKILQMFQIKKGREISIQGLTLLISEIFRRPKMKKGSRK